MRLKSKLGLMLGIMALSDVNVAESRQASRKKLAQKIQRRQTSEKIHKGLKEFKYGQNTVWALNQQNADRKARKNNWI